MSALRKRFDYATEMRAFAKEVAALPGGIDVALRMRTRATDVMKRQDPAERGRIDPASIFKAGGEHAIGRVEVRNLTRRLLGKLGLKAA